MRFLPGELVVACSASASYTDVTCRKYGCTVYRNELGVVVASARFQGGSGVVCFGNTITYVVFGKKVGWFDSITLGRCS